MKWRFLLIIILAHSLNIYAQEEENYENLIINNLTLNMLYNFFIFENINNPGESVLTSLKTSSVSLGIGYHLNFIPNILSPGLYAEVGISAINLLWLLSKMQENNEEFDYDMKISSFGFFGIRLYNQFRINYIDIQPFIGLNIFGVIKNSETTGVGCINFGLLFAYKFFCVEYSYYIPQNSDLRPIHRIGIGGHLRKI